MKVNARPLSKAKVLGVFVNQIDAQSVAHFVEVHVIGSRQGPFEVDIPQGFPAGVAHINQPVPAGVVDQFVRSYLLFFQCRRTGDNLKRRTGRIFPGNGLVGHGMERVRIQVVPVLFADAVHKPVGVKARPGDQGLHFPVVGVQHHHGAAPGPNGLQLAVHRFFRDFLELGIDGEHQALPGLGLHLIHDLDHTAHHVHFFPVAAVFPSQVGVIVAFQACLADNVPGFQVAVHPLFNFVIADFPHIPQYVDGQLLVGIVPHRLHFHHYPGQVAQIFFNLGHHFRRSIPYQPDGFRPYGMELDGILDFLHGQVQNNGQPLQSFLVVAVGTAH